MSEECTGLSEVLDRIEAGTDGADEVSIGDIMEIVGQRSFGPLLLVPGLAVLSPLSGIPSFPTICAVMILLISVQMLFGCRHFWLPRFITERSIHRASLKAPMRFLRPVARVTDRIIRPRLDPLTRRPFSYLIAATCILVAVTMPPLELLPFLSSVAGAVVTGFALSLVAHDGLLALLAFMLTGVMAVLAVKMLMAAT